MLVRKRGALHLTGRQNHLRIQRRPFGRVPRLLPSQLLHLWSGHPTHQGPLRTHLRRVAEGSYGFCYIEQIGPP